jgi:universal stress protein A
MPAVRRILVPVDFSETARAACDWACSLAAEHGAEVLLLHVFPPAAAFDPTGALLPEPPGHREKLREKLRRFCPPDPAVRVSHWLDEGDPAGAILRLAALLGCDLVVMGTHGRTGLSRLLLGSVAEQVLRRAGCPVLTVNRAAALGRKPVAEPAPQLAAAGG